MSSHFIALLSSHRYEASFVPCARHVVRAGNVPLGHGPQPRIAGPDDLVLSPSSVVRVDGRIVEDVGREDNHFDELRRSIAKDDSPLATDSDVHSDAKPTSIPAVNSRGQPGDLDKCRP